ncbi:MAG: Gfo/Idh/MocA family oxidoreductase [Candidatus Bathyarchaeia archaeon]
MKVKIGIIGAGKIANSHARSYLSLSNVQILAVCDINKEAAKNLALEYSIPKVYTDYHDMLADKDIDAVSICTPNYLHAPISIDSLEAGKHVLCEKPVAMNAVEAEKVRRKVKESRKVFVIGHWLPHTPEAKILKKMIDSQKLGEIYFVKAGWIRKFMFPDPRWYSVKDKSGGGPLMDIGTHIIDLTLWMMNYPDPSYVLSSVYTCVAPKQLRNLYNDLDSVYNVEDMAAAMIKLKNGCTVMLETSWACYIEREKIYLNIYGTEGGAEIFPSTRGGEPFPLRIFSDEERTAIIKIPDLTRMERIVPVTYFIDCIVHGDDPTIATIDGGVKVMRIVDAIYESAKRNESIHL